jgi:hypothetical protein
LKSLTKYIAFSIVCYAFVTTGQSQQKDVPVIFQETQPLSLRLGISLREIKRSISDTVYFPSYLQYRDDQGVWDSLQIGIRARGNFRRKHCVFPPLRIKIKKGDADGTPLEGNRNFKLVVPCQNVKAGNILILKEYVCYKLLEPVTTWFFHTRLADITLTDLSGRQSKSYPLKSFLIEDDDQVAHRFNGEIFEQAILPMQLNDTASVVHDFFQYLIGNTDWSARGQHNTKVILLSHNKKVPLAYDFDMAGLVNPPYATVNESLKIANVQERLYRGYCRNESTMEYVRSEYLRLEQEIMKVVSDHESYFSEGEYNGITNYIKEFFNTLKNDNKFEDAILLQCRKD